MTKLEVGEQTVLISEKQHPLGCVVPRNDDGGGGSGGGDRGGGGGGGGNRGGGGSPYLRGGGGLFDNGAGGSDKSGQDNGDNNDSDNNDGSNKLARSDSSKISTLPEDTIGLDGISVSPEFFASLNNPSLAELCVGGGAASGYGNRQGLLGQISSLFSRLFGKTFTRGESVVTALIGTFPEERGSGAGSSRTPSTGYAFFAEVRGASTPFVSASEAGVNKVSVQTLSASTVDGVGKLVHDMTDSEEEARIARSFFYDFDNALKVVSGGHIRGVAVGGYVTLKESSDGSTLFPHVLSVGIATPKSVVDRLSSTQQAALAVVPAFSLTVGAGPAERLAAGRDFIRQIYDLKNVAVSTITEKDVQAYTPRDLSHPVYKNIVTGLMSAGVNPAHYEVHTFPFILTQAALAASNFYGQASFNTSGGFFNSAQRCVGTALGLNTVANLNAFSDTDLGTATGLVPRPAVVSPSSNNLAPRPGLRGPLQIQPEYPLPVSPSSPRVKRVVPRRTPQKDISKTI